MTSSTRRRVAALPLALTAAGTAAALATLSGITRAARGVPMSMGAGPDLIRPAAENSPHFSNGVFHNSEPTHVLLPGEAFGMIPAMLRHRGRGRPAAPVPLATPAIDHRAGDLAVTWLGHATALIEIDGYYVLSDPVWGERVSPSTTVGPSRIHPVPIAVAALPQLDAIVISHDHYDHLDLPTIRALLQTQQAPFVVPLGIGAHLRLWGVPESRIVELDWDGSHTVRRPAPEHTGAGELRLTCTEARHFSGRGFTRNLTLWCSWAITGPRHRVYFGGDTGYAAAFTGLGRRYGPFDLTLLPIGAYGDQWPHIHLAPEEALRMHRDLGGGTLVPIHWATFDLAMHAWSEPADRLTAAADDVRVVIPRPGERVNPDRRAGGNGPASAGDWWRAIS